MPLYIYIYIYKCRYMTKSSLREKFYGDIIKVTDKLVVKRILGC